MTNPAEYTPVAHMRGGLLRTKKRLAYRKSLTIFIVIYTTIFLTFQIVFQYKITHFINAIRLHITLHIVLIVNITHHMYDVSVI